MRREIDEIAGEQLEIGMHGAKLDIAAEQHSCDAPRLRAGKGIVEPLGEPWSKRRGAREARRRTAPCAGRGFGWIDAGERGGEEVGLLLIVAFEADPVARTKNCFQEIGQIRGCNCFAAGVARPCLNAGLPRRFLL